MPSSRAGVALPETEAPWPIAFVAERLGLARADYEPYGWTKAKLALGLEKRLLGRPLGKYVGVTAMTPTPAGEGKTVTSIGLAMALCRLGHGAVAALRQPSQAPVFGIKGGGAGGGLAALLPVSDVNLHLTGDAHAVAAAHNLLAALVDNHLRRGRSPLLDPRSIAWRRVVDVGDKGLSRVLTGLGGPKYGPARMTGFDLTAASEVMAILALSADLADLKRRLAEIIVGFTPGGGPVRASDIGAAGAMAALLKDAVRPNLVQTSEHTPALVHAGPFGNIAHGNSSILADQAGLRLCDYVITEGGFGSESGAEKFFDIKCRASGLKPDAEVLVASVRAAKWHSGRYGPKPGPELDQENLKNLREGAANLAAHVEILRQFGVPIVVAVNRFPADTDREVEELLRLALEFGADYAAPSEVYARGGEGGLELARAVAAACRRASAFKPLYSLELPAEEKVRLIATRLYGASDVDFSEEARANLERWRVLGFGELPVCVAKTQYSLSHDPSLLGRPRGFRLPVRDVRLCAGAGFLYALTGDVSTMPGLPAEPAALSIDVDEDGHVTGLR